MSTVVDAELARQLSRQAARVGQMRPALARTGLAVGIGAVTAWRGGPATGVVIGAVAVLMLVGFPLALIAARTRGQVCAGDLRTTGYDREGRFVWEGSTRRTHPAGWARSVERRGDLRVLRPRAARVQATLLPAALLTEVDVAFLTRGGADPLALPLSTVMTPAIRAGLRGALLRNLATLPVLGVAVVLFAVQAVILSGATWPTTLAYAAGATVITLALAALLLAGLARAGLRDGRVLRSGVVGEALRLDGSRLLPGEVPLELVRSGTPRGVTVRLRHGFRWVAVPLDLVPDEDRPSPAH